jgi:hypothetical protein
LKQDVNFSTLFPHLIDGWWSGHSKTIWNSIWNVQNFLNHIKSSRKLYLKINKTSHFKTLLVATKRFFWMEIYQEFNVDCEVRYTLACPFWNVPVFRLFKCPHATSLKLIFGYFSNHLSQSFNRENHFLFWSFLMERQSYKCEQLLKSL